ncbi:PssE/Cps14G family polysaccharide biosynthesis glycosyltransferase [Maribacter sp. HTCC2170]|uniref:PssE/Cps14G family polysaccharide biosynthesis glycosyltransferase n=1 Tax=Maribacter sp. (strain HTCC2170 / KCCM 42371) TaxID=313603 RepID=UPI00006BD1CF|nr:PssE/Cps14G family polysaccharide biosynthesis glycosyltransferase [Maribacter sp. HTCC2170]EAR02766.1 exopolysaccharide biosynthesis protein, glycosyltransferase [Maribacter sp. HTCC2170]
MVFVTLGNQNFQFKRLLTSLEKLKKEGVIKQEILAQVGHTDFESDKIKIKELLSKEEFDQCIDRADFVICHAGTGSIINAIKNNKKVIVAARLAEHNEHIDNHQLEIKSAFEKKGYILGTSNDMSDLSEKIKMINEFIPKEFVSNNKEFNNQLISIIKTL